MSTSGIGMRRARVSMLTVGIHSAASGFRRGISTSDPVHFVDLLRTFTVRIHRVESEFVRRISTPEHACCVIAASHSPLKYTGIRLAAAAVVHVRNCVAFPGHTPTLTVGNHSASSGLGGRISTWAHVPPSMEDVPFAALRRPAIHTGRGSSPDRASTLTLEIHSAASRFGGRISTRQRASSPFATSRPSPA